MPQQYLMPLPAEQDLPYEAADIAQGLGIQLATCLFPLLVPLDRVLDKRLVRTFLSVRAKRTGSPTPNLAIIVLPHAQSLSLA